VKPREGCPICARGELERFLRIDGVPVMTTQLWADASTADAAPRGDLDLAVCNTCGAIRNLAFDAALVEYTGDYENSQLFSPAFRDYAQALAVRLVDEFELRTGTVLEFGCGKGEFLEMLCAAGCGRAVGFDPSYGGEIDHGEFRDRVRIERRLLGSDDVVPADLVVSRHVIEHLEDPFPAVRGLRSATGDPAASLYLEVPHVRYVLSASGMWDLIYPHVSYFGPESIKTLVRRAGFRPTVCESAFGGQFLTVRAEPDAASAEVAVDDEAVAQVLDDVRRFGAEFRDTLTEWQALLSDGDDTALWGAGAKGVTFLNAVAGGGGIDVVVDLNPRKQGRFLPGTGQQVVSPERLRERAPARVIVMNPMYRDEVAAALGQMDVAAEVLVA
jgi:SAM-dependent methyltransferase